MEITKGEDGKVYVKGDKTRFYKDILYKKGGIWNSPEQRWEFNKEMDEIKKFLQPFNPKGSVRKKRRTSEVSSEGAKDEQDIEAEIEIAKSMWQNTIGEKQEKQDFFHHGKFSKYLQYKVIPKKKKKPEWVTLGWFYTKDQAELVPEIEQFLSDKQIATRIHQV